MDGEGEHRTQHGEASGANQDAHDLDPMAGTEAMVGTATMNAHDPIANDTPTPMDAHAGDEDATIPEHAGDGDAPVSTEVDKMFVMLLDRVTRLEDRMENVVGGIANILGELEGIGLYVREKRGVQTSGNHGNKQGTHVHVSTSTPFEWQQCVNQSNVCDANMDASTPPCSQTQLVRQADETRRASPTRPNVVDLDSTSTPSGDNLPKGKGKITIEDSPGTRVQRQARMRVVPQATRAVGVGACAVRTSAPIPYAPKYKDAPSHEDVADFGDGKEHYYKPPLLRPKNHGVSC